MAGTGATTHYVYNPLTDVFSTAAAAAPFAGMGVPFTYKGVHYFLQGTDYYELTPADVGAALTWAGPNTYDINVGTDGGWALVFEGYAPVAEAPESLADLDTFDLAPPNAMALDELDWLSSYE